MALGEGPVQAEIARTRVSVRLQRGGRVAGVRDNKSLRRFYFPKRTNYMTAARTCFHSASRSDPLGVACGGIVLALFAFSQLSAFVVLVNVLNCAVARNKCSRSTQILDKQPPLSGERKASSFEVGCDSSAD